MGFKSENKKYSQPWDVSYYNFDLKDSKGRVIGARIQTKIVEYTAIEGTNLTAYWDIEPGVYFAFIPHATRNGEIYGPVQNERRFKTRLERENAIDKYLKDARKRASK